MNMEYGDMGSTKDALNMEAQVKGTNINMESGDKETTELEQGGGTTKVEKSEGTKEVGDIEGLNYNMNDIEGLNCDKEVDVDLNYEEGVTIGDNGTTKVEQGGGNIKVEQSVGTKEVGDVEGLNCDLDDIEELNCDIDDIEGLNCDKEVDVDMNCDEEVDIDLNCAEAEIVGESDDSALGKNFENYDDDVVMTGEVAANDAEVSEDDEGQMTEKGKGEREGKGKGKRKGKGKGKGMGKGKGKFGRPCNKKVSECEASGERSLLDNDDDADEEEAQLNLKGFSDIEDENSEYGFE